MKKVLLRKLFVVGIIMLFVETGFIVYSIGGTITDRSFGLLVESVTQIGMRNGEIPGPLMAINNNPIVIVSGDDDSYQSTTSSQVYFNGDYPPIAMAGFIEEGRVVAVSHEGFFTEKNIYDFKNLQFGKNIVAWLDSAHKKKILFDDNLASYGWKQEVFDGLVFELQKVGYSVDVSSGSLSYTSLQQYGVLMICNSWDNFSQTELTAIQSYVDDGGGVFLMGLGWSWVAYHPNSTLEKYPMNVVGRLFGIKFLDGVISDPTNNLGNIDNPLFHTFYSTEAQFPGEEEDDDSDFIPSVSENQKQQSDSQSTSIKSFEKTLSSSASLTLVDGVRISATYTVDATMHIPGDGGLPGERKNCEITLRNGQISLSVDVDIPGVSQSGSKQQSLALGSNTEIPIPDTAGMITVPVKIFATVKNIQGSNIISFDTTSLDFKQEGMKTFGVTILDNAQEGEFFDVSAVVNLDLEVGVIAVVPFLGENELGRETIPMTAMTPTMGVTGVVKSQSFAGLESLGLDMNNPSSFVLPIIMILIFISVIAVAIVVIKRKSKKKRMDVTNTASIQKQKDAVNHPVVIQKNETQGIKEDETTITKSYVSGLFLIAIGIIALICGFILSSIRKIDRAGFADIPSLPYSPFGLILIIISIILIIAGINKLAKKK